MKSDKLHTILLLIAIAMMTMAFFNVYFRTPGEVVMVDTVTVSDTLYLHDTLTVDNPVPYLVEKVKTDTVFTPAGDTIQLVTETKKYEENIIQDQDTAVVKAQITGINAEIDTISVMFNRREVINTIEITKYIEKKRKFLQRFHFSPNVSAGYGVFNRNLDVYVGFGVAYEL